MNYKIHVERAISKARSTISEIEHSIINLEEALDKTSEFLKICGSLGIKTVGIRKTHEDIKSSSSWHDGFDAVYADESTNKDGSGWPAIWEAVEIAGISGGCGNSGQHQIQHDAKLIDGVYRLKNGKWKMIQDPENNERS